MHICNQIQQMCNNRNRCGITYRKERKKMMDEKTMQRIRKLQVLAERGIGGEKTTAEEKLRKMLEKNGIYSMDELQSEKCEYTLFPYNGRYERKLLKQCIYKVLTAAGDRTYYHTRGTRQKLGIYCTKAQRMEIKLEFEFYRNIFYEELDIFMDAFINAQGIFPPDAPKDSTDSPSGRDLKIAYMAGMIDRRTRTAMIDTDGGGR